MTTSSLPLPDASERLGAETREPWLSDEEVIRRVIGGDIAFFEHVMRRYNKRLYRLVRSIVKHDQEAEDVMQEAYINALVHLGDFEGRAQFSTWLTRIAMREAFARTRDRRRQEPLDDVLQGGEDATATPEQLAADSELRGILERAVLALPEHFRTVFVLRSVEQLSVAETAEALDISAESVRTRLHRARALLRAKLSRRIDAVLPSVLEFGGERCNRVVFAVLHRLLKNSTRSACSSVSRPSSSTES